MRRNSVASRASLLLLAAAVLLNVANSAEDNSLQAVAKDQLDGSRVKIPEMNCSIDAPGKDWAWMKDKNPATKSYSCVNKEEGLLIRVQFAPDQKANDVFLRGMMSGMRKAFVRGGAKVSSEKLEQVAFPPHGKTWRAKYHFEFEGGGDAWVSCHVLQIGDSVAAILHDCGEEDESEALKALIKSVLVEKK